MINLYQLVTFCTVLNEGSMTAAADKLYLTQPAVSQQIRALEEELNVELLVRGVRQVKPTLQGQLLYDYAKKIIQLSQQAEIAIQAIGTKLKGSLKVGTINSVGLHLISPVIGLFLKYNTDLQLKLELSRGAALIEMMNRQELDVLILPDTGEEYGVEIENVEKRFLIKGEMWLVASGKDPTVPKSIQFNDIFSKPYVTFSGEFPGFSRVLNEKSKLKGKVPDPVFESSNVGTLKRVIESGLGWGFLPSHCIQKQIRSNRLVRIHVEDFSYETDYNFYSRKEFCDSVVTDVFYRAIQHHSQS